MTKIGPEEFRDTTQAAKRALGRTIYRRQGSDIYQVLVVETWAHEGYGKHTTNRDGINYGAGRIYVMFHRGHNALNVATGKEGEPSCIWIRDVYPLVGLSHKQAKSPFTFTKAMQIDRSLDGFPIDGEDLWMEGDPAPESRILDLTAVKKAAGDLPTNCIGVYRLNL